MMWCIYESHTLQLAKVCKQTSACVLSSITAAAAAKKAYCQQNIHIQLQKTGVRSKFTQWADAITW